MTTPNLLWNKAFKEKELKGVLGIDPSLTGSAWCYGNGSSQEDLTVKDLPNNLRGEVRIIWLILRLRECLETYKPKIICFEDYSYGSHSSAYDLAELGGPLRVMLHEYKLLNPTAQVYKFSPNELKKFVTKKGTSKKEEMMLQLYKRFNIEAKNNNQADAIGLFLMGLNGETPAEKKQKKKKKA